MVTGIEAVVTVVMLRVNLHVRTDTEPFGSKPLLSQQTCANYSSFCIDSSQGFLGVQKSERNSRVTESNFSSFINSPSTFVDALKRLTDGDGSTLVPTSNGSTLFVTSLLI